MLKVTQRVVFDGWKSYKLACGPQIVETPDGDLLCYWLSGSDSEPATDNCSLMARSSDRGCTWSEPSVPVPAGREASVVGPMSATRNGRLISFGYRWPSHLHYTVAHVFRMESSDSGRTWSEPEPVKIRKEDNIIITSAIRLSNGEYLLPATFSEKRPQPLVAPVSRLCRAKDEAEALAMPPGEGQTARKFGTHLYGCSVLISQREDLRIVKEYGHIANRPLGLLESTCVQLRDGRIVMLMRAEWGGFLWRAESADNGRTWTDAWETDIPNPSSLPFLIRLADGRITLLHNATGRKGEFGLRNPLSIWISDDELDSWCIKEDVLATSGNPRPSRWPPDTPDQLAYPYAILLDNNLVFTYDRNRRQVMFVEVRIE